MKKVISLLVLGFISFSAISQSWWPFKGNLTGSLESNSMYYFKDTKIDPNNNYKGYRFATHDYLKLDYSIGKFSAGVQLETYLPALRGYDFGDSYKKFFLGSKYIQWEGEKFFARIGNIYEQFGSGIIFRSYEDRALGFNNSLEGAQISYNFGNIVRITGITGRPRFTTGYASSWVSGADLNLSLSDIFKWDNLFFSLEGSYVNRYEKLDKKESINFRDEFGFDSKNLNMFSGRINFGTNTVNFKGEYIIKDKADLNSYSFVTGKPMKGNALLGELSVNINKFAMLATLRRLDGMETLLTIYERSMYNTLNYLPALTRQYTYSLANLNPYIPNTNGEFGGQIDFYYSLKNKKSKFWNFHANFSTFSSLENADTKSMTLWRDINFDIERQWSKNLKTAILYSRQQFDPNRGNNPDSKLHTSNIFVLDVTNKFSKKVFLRSELQYCTQEETYNNEKDWVAALFELSFAPKWSIFVGDMYNIERDTLLQCRI
jgi:hypothetical protein